MNKFSLELRKFFHKHKRNTGNILITAISTISLFIFFISYVKIYIPIQQETVTNQNKLFEYSQKELKMNELRELQTKTENNKNELNDIYEAMLDIVPDKRNIPFVTSQISLAASNNDVNVLDMTKINESDIVLNDDKFRLVKYKLICNGTFSNAVNFLATIEKSNSIFAIESLKVTTPTEDAVSSTVDLAITLNIYMKNSTN